jgi:hypothetical protein
MIFLIVYSRIGAACFAFAPIQPPHSQKQKPPIRVVCVFGGGLLALIEQKTNKSFLI